MSKGKVFVFSGCSGVGKSTVLGKVMEARKDLIFSVSATTRDPREGEVEGVHYYFVTHEQFQKLIDEDGFMEYDAHMKNSYGTPREQFEEKRSRGHVVLDIDPNGAFRLQKSCPEAVLIFIAPPSLEVLKERLLKRGDTPADQIPVRLERAAWEMEQGKKYHHYLINDVLDDCVSRVLDIIAREAD